MKPFETICLGAFLLLSGSVFGQTQGLLGSWQLVKESHCLEESARTDDGDTQALREDMESRSSATPSVVTFKDNISGEESTRILGSAKTANNKRFLYKFNGETLLILDKKSQTISDSYLVEKCTADSLIISNAARPCETKIFLKINRDGAN